MKINYDQLKTIPIEEVLGRYENDLREANVAGDVKLVGHCPICHSNGGKRRNNNQFQATLKSKDARLENTFHCFACECRGSVLDFVVLKEGLMDWQEVDWHRVGESRKKGERWNWCSKDALKQASALLWEWFFTEKPDIPEEKPELKPEEPRNKTWAKRWPDKPMPSYFKFYRVNEYLRSRGISQAVLDEFQVGYYENPRSRSPLNGHILFPIHNIQGELTGFCWRVVDDSSPRYCFPPKEQFDRTLELWNVHRAVKEGSRVYVVEGFFSVMALWQAGFRCCVAAMGSNLSEAQAETLIREFEIVVLVLDPDEPGRKFGRQALKLLLSRIPVQVLTPARQVDELEEVAELFEKT